jgi:hypothetical protein
VSDRTIIDAINDAGPQAGPVDAGWNRRFVDALEAMGFQVVEKDHANDREMWAPIPWHEGWQYPYPSVIVRRTREPHTQGDAP